MIKLSIQQLPHGKPFPLPSYATEDSAGLDLVASIPHEMILGPSKRICVPTGIAIQLPKGFEAQIRSRSGLAVKNGLFVLNSPGTIDADYRGEIVVIMMNLGDESFVFQPGMRIAQMVIAPYTKVSLDCVGELSSTVRGANGFGSTGL
jgi:dUTP pyrophosphatase